VANPFGESDISFIGGKKAELVDDVTGVGIEVNLTQLAKSRATE
jgi:hypothetical protein